MSSDSADAADPRPRETDSPDWRRSIDLLVAASLVLVAGLAALALPGGGVRLAITVPVLMLAPGYLLLQALLVPARSVGDRGRHLLLSLGVSPAVLGLMALSTAIVPGGFTEGVILAVVTLGCLVLAGVGYRRRRATARVVAGDEEDVTQTA